MVSASVKSSQRPRARLAAVQRALFLPVQPFSSFAGLDYRDTGKAAGDFRRAVGRVVVHDDQLPVAAQFEDLFRLADQRLEAGAQAILLVARRNNDRQLDQLCRLRLVEDRSGTDLKAQARQSAGGALRSPASSARPSTGFHPPGVRLLFSFSMGSLGCFQSLGLVFASSSPRFVL